MFCCCQFSCGAKRHNCLLGAVMSLKYFHSKPVSILAVCVSLLIPVTSQAGIENDMADMFNNAGVESNYTQAGAFHGQTGSLYTGGSLSVRAPVSDVNLANFQWPSVSAGCGGIDMFAGAFSFVNKEQFIQFTRNLGNNAAGVAFDLALKALDPMIQDAIGGIRYLVNKVNQSNINSCEMSKQLVGGAMGVLGQSMASNCSASAVDTGSSEDGSAARFFCNYGSNLVNESSKVTGTNRPADTISFTGGNFTYKALSGKLNDNDMDFYYSLMGTAVYPKPKSDDDTTIKVGPSVYMPTITNLNYLLSGKSDNNSGDTETITIDMVTCIDGDAAMKENCSIKNNVSIPSLRYQVKKLTESMVEKMKSNAEWSNADVADLSKFINTSRLPILRMGITDAFMGTSNLSKTSIIDAIAIDYLASLVSKAENAMRISLGVYNKTDESSDRKVKQLFDNLDHLRTSIAQERQDVMKKVEIEETFLRALTENDNQWRAHFVDTAGSLTFDQNNQL